MFKKVLLFFVVTLHVSLAGAQTARERWVDSVMAKLAAHEKIGQLFVLQARVPVTAADWEDLAEKIKRFHPGSVEFVGSPYGDVKTLIQRLRGMTSVPLLIGWDENRLLIQADSGHAFPSHLQLAAIANDSLVGKVNDLAATWIAAQGVDYTTGMRVDALDVGSTTWQHQLRQVGGEPGRIKANFGRWAASLQRSGVFAVPEFETPDSHLDWTKGDSLRLSKTEDFFFLRDTRVKIVRSTDFHFRVRTNDQTYPAARSGQFIQHVIRKQLRYPGLLNYVVPANENEDYLSIFLAGNNIVTTATINARQLSAINKSFRKNKLLKVHLDQSLRQLLTLKFDVITGGTKNSINTWWWHAPEKRMLFQQVFENSITVVQNKSQTLPIRNLDLQKLALITIGPDQNRAFELQAKRYAPLIKKSILQSNDTTAGRGFEEASIVIVAVYDPHLGREVMSWLKKHTATKQVVVCHLAGISNLDQWAEFDALLAGFAPAAEVTNGIVQTLFGVEPGQGVLPLVPKGNAPAVQTVEPLPRFAFTQPEAVEMDSHTLAKIEPIVQEAIAAGATPGAQIVIARKGKIVYQKSFGTLTYTSTDPVTDSTLYDLASVTKVSATLQAIMFLHEKKLIDLNKKASAYLPELKGTNKEDMVLRDILTHQAGLWPFLPFWASTMKDSVWLADYYQQATSPDYPWPVAENLYARHTMKDSLWNWIIQSKVREKRLRTPYDYRYSDMGFYILHRLAEKLLNQPIDEFLAQNLYEPLGAFSLGYLPRARYSKAQIAPTEQDKLFRKSLLVGYVHDQGAAMHGGIAGHAGLFGTALDLAKLGQLWLNGGTYGDTRFFQRQTVNLFTSRQFTPSRRGLGWDKPILNDWSSPTALAASPFTFGHTGFTGTCIWVDPAYELVYVFLSNRVHPDMNNNKLLNLNIRPRIQEVVYQSVFNYMLYQPTARN